MNRSLTIAAVAVAVALALPSGAATWKAYGGFEPDSVYDSSDFMWFDAPVGAEKKIYFNAFQTNFQLANPNVGALETRFNSVPELFWNAMLGQWTDCNGDGYVGLAETAVEEYRAELLATAPQPDLCPAGSAHNKNSWVTELVWIGTNIGGLNKNSDPRIVVDTEAMIWGDQGLPIPLVPDAVQASQSSTCPLAGIPRGTFQTTGGILDYAECFEGHFVAANWNDLILGRTFADGAVVYPGLDPGDANGLALANESKWNEPGHPLNQQTLGDEDAENSYVSVVDCSQPTYLQQLVQPVADPLLPEPANEVADNTYPYGPRPVGSPSVNANGNVAGTVNRTNEDLSTDPGEDTNNPTSNCNTTDDNGQDVYGQLESDDAGTASTDSSYKTRADLNFNFTAMKRGGAPLGAGTLGPQWAGVWGLGYFGGGFVGGSNTMWISDGGYVTAPSLVRADVDTATVQGDNATFWTFYAKIGNAGKATGQLPSAAVGTYGALFCPSFGAGSGAHHGWECDGSKWYLDAQGNPGVEEFPHARPGLTYQLRDVDCFDGTLLNLPVGIETGALGEITCQSARLQPNPN